MLIRRLHEVHSGKTQSNIREYGNHVIEYCGNAFNMDMKHVKPAHSFSKGTYLGCRFRFWNVARPVPYKDGEK